MISESPMQVAKEMEKLGFNPENVLTDHPDSPNFYNMDGWTDTLVDALEKLAGVESKVLMAMKTLGNIRRNERRLAKELSERHNSREEDIT